MKNQKELTWKEIKNKKSHVHATSRKEDFYIAVLIILIIASTAQAIM